MVTPPGLESLCRDELAALEDPPQELILSRGGVSFKGRLTSCYQANLDAARPVASSCEFRDSRPDISMNSKQLLGHPLGNLF